MMHSNISSERFSKLKILSRPPSVQQLTSMSAYIVQATRSAAGRHKGALRGTHPVTLGGLILNGLIDKVPSLDPSDVDDVIFGCVSQVGENAFNLARQCVLSSKMPESVPGTTVDRQCGR